MEQDLVGSLILSSDNLIDFHSEMYLVLVTILIYLCTNWNIK